MVKGKKSKKQVIHATFFLNIFLILSHMIYPKATNAIPAIKKIKTILVIPIPGPMYNILI